MKTFFIVILVYFSGVLFSQEMRFFEFRVECGHGNWQDTSFIAAASNDSLINEVLFEITKPIEERRFILGNIKHGHGGFNRNGSHWFSWHFVPDQWLLAEVSVEVCDGCPYSDIDNNKYYWIDTLGYFCPWSAKPMREVTISWVNHNSPKTSQLIYIYPNPAREKIYIKNFSGNEYNFYIYDIGGRLFKYGKVSNTSYINVTSLPAGLYFIKFLCLKSTLWGNFSIVK